MKHIAKKRFGMVVGLEGWVFFKNATFMRVFDVGFQLQHPLGPRHFEHMEHEAEELQIRIFLIRLAFQLGF